MPRNASAAKRAAVERYGAEISLCDNTLDARRAVLAEVVARTGAVEIHPFDDERVIAGAGTAALELIDEVPGLDAVVTPVGGGGLCSGTCVAVAPTPVIGGVPRDRASTSADGLRTGCSPRTDAILASPRRRATRRRRAGRDRGHARRVAADETDDRAERGRGLRGGSSGSTRRRARRHRLLGRQRRSRRAPLVTPAIRPRPRRAHARRDAAASLG